IRTCVSLLDRALAVIASDALVVVHRLPVLSRDGPLDVAAVVCLGHRSGVAAGSSVRARGGVRERARVGAGTLNRTIPSRGLATGAGDGRVTTRLAIAGCSGLALCSCAALIGPTSAPCS